MRSYMRANERPQESPFALCTLLKWPILFLASCVFNTLYWRTFGEPKLTRFQVQFKIV